MDEVGEFKSDFKRHNWSFVVVRIFIVLLILLSLFLVVSSFGSASILIDGHDFDSRGGFITNNITTFVYNNSVNNISNNYFIENNFTTFVTNNITTFVNMSYDDSVLWSAFNYLNGTSLRTFGDNVMFGDLTINGNLNVIGSYVNLTVVNEFMNGSILPELSGVFDLGSPAMAWNNVYANNLYNKSDVDSLIASVNVTTFIENNNTFFVNYTFENNFTTYVYNGSSFGVGDGYLYDNGSNVIFFNVSRTDLRYDISSYSMSMIVSGNGSVTSPVLDGFVITRISVVPTSLSNSYNFEALDNSSLDVIDRNRVLHSGDWIIRKYYSINDTVVLCNLFNVSIAEDINITVTYQNNGVV